MTPPHMEEFARGAVAEKEGPPCLPMTVAYCPSSLRIVIRVLTYHIEAVDFFGFIIVQMESQDAAL